MIAFIQVKTTGGLSVRVQVEEIRAVIDGKVLQLQLSANLRIPVEDETMETLWSKMEQASGYKIHLIKEASRDRV